MKRIPRLLSTLVISMALVLSPLVATGCSVSEPTSIGTLSITDDTGATISFDKPVESIVSMAPSNTEVVYFVNAGSKLIGRTDYCNYPSEVSSVESIGGYSTPNKEKIVTLDPDVVLATSMHVSNGDVAWLEEHGLKVVVLDPKDIDGIMKDIMMVGELTANKDAAAQKVNDLEARIKDITDRTASLSADSRPGSLFVTWHDPLWTQGSGAFMDSVITIAGGTNIFSDVSNDVEVDIELAVTRNPKFIIVTGSMGSNTTSYDYIVAADSPFKATDAYKNENVMLLDGDLATRPGPRLIDALELVAKLLHPEIFN